MINTANALFLLSAVLASVGIFFESGYVGGDPGAIAPDRAAFHRRHRRIFKMFFALAATSVLLLLAGAITLQMAVATWIAPVAIGLGVAMSDFVAGLLICSNCDMKL